MNFIEKLFKKKEPTKTIYDILEAEKILFAAKPQTTEISIPIKYNTQKDNVKFDKIPPSSQCAYTSVAMLLSAFIPDAEKDIFISDMILNFEKNFLAGKGSRSALRMSNLKPIIQYYLSKYNINKQVVFIPKDGTIDDILDGLKNGSPVLFSWMATSHGHYSVIIGYSEIKKSFEVHDPWGKFDFTKKTYGIGLGNNNIHSIDDISPYMNKSSESKKGYRITYLK